MTAPAVSAGFEYLEKDESLGVRPAFIVPEILIVPHLSI
jgi:hypothetical protein